MTEIPRQSLNGPKSLASLSLANNRIKTIKQNDFAAQRDLRKVTLAGNDLSTIEGGSFTGMINLREISLAANLFSRLNSDVFSGMRIPQRKLFYFFKMFSLKGTITYTKFQSRPWVVL